MIVGVPKEIKTDEYRVSMTPAGVHDLVARGHKVLLEDLAGEGSGITNQNYLEQGAEIVSHQEIFAKSDMIVKVKEPLPEEYGLLREGQILYTYLHLAPAPELTQALLDQKIVGARWQDAWLCTKAQNILNGKTEGEAFCSAVYPVSTPAMW